MIVCTFQAEPTQSPQVSLVHTFALNPGVMWEPASYRSAWFGRLRPLTKGGGPLSLTFESRRISQTQAPSRWLGCRVLRGYVCTKVTTMSRLSKEE